MPARPAPPPMQSFTKPPPRSNSIAWRNPIATNTHAAASYVNATEVWHGLAISLYEQWLIQGFVDVRTSRKQAVFRAFSPNTETQATDEGYGMPAKRLLIRWSRRDLFSLTFFGCIQVAAVRTALIDVQRLFRPLAVNVASRSESLRNGRAATKKNPGEGRGSRKDRASEGNAYPASSSGPCRFQSVRLARISR